MAYYSGQMPGSPINNIYDDPEPDYMMNGHHQHHQHRQPTTTHIPPEHTHNRLLERHPQQQDFQRHQPVANGAQFTPNRIYNHNRHRPGANGAQFMPRKNSHNPHKRQDEILMNPMGIHEPDQPTHKHHKRKIETRNIQSQPPKAKAVPQRHARNRVAPQRAWGDMRPKRSEVSVCTKHTLFFINFIVFIIGAGLTSLGAYILHIKEKKVRDVLDFLLDPSCDMTLVGSIFFIMGFIGLVGALRENTFLRKTHNVLMVIFLLVQMGVIILVFVCYSSSDARDTVFPTEAFRDAIRKYRDDIDMKDLIDNMQTGLKCCGLSDSEEGFLDWNDNRYFTCINNTQSPERCSVPSSCCKQIEGKIRNHQCGWRVFKIDKQGKLRPNEEATNLTVLNQLGCLKAMAEWVDKHALVVGGVLLGILLPQLFQVALTSSLNREILLQKLRWL